MDKIKAAVSELKILIVDDEPANVQLLEMLLRHANLFNFKSTTDSREVLPLYFSLNPDLVLLDLTMPHLDGFQVLAQLRQAIPPDTYLPILVLTAIVTPEAKRKALAAGASDFLTKPFDVTEVLLRVNNLLETRRLHLQLQSWNATLDQTVQERTVELSKALAELRSTQRQVVQQERLRALEVMAGGVAHDFNNVLSVVQGFGELVLADCLHHPERGADPEAVRAIITAAQDGARMVTRLREFYRPGSNEERLLVDLNGLAAQAVALTEPRWKTQAVARGAQIIAQVEAANDLPKILADPAELREALTNLIFNAVDALPRGGRITLRTSVEKGRVILEVQDSGAGMSDEVRQRCLEPFFTTKGDKGTGLGLAMVYGIVQRHDGEMEIESAPDRGTTFRFRFPACAEQTARGEAGEIPLSRPLKILVVDDEPFICEMLMQLLTFDCHQAESAHDAEEALARIKGEVFDLMITDLSMPFVSGGQLAESVKAVSPTTRIILLTGFGAEERLDHGGADIDLVLGKPVSHEALRQAIVKVTSAQPDSAVGANRS